ncbi:MAG: lysylphosphatidylglycerol synthase domain-containing protein, partial [bacterium]
MKKTLATVLKLILIAICFHLIFRKLNIADVEGRLRGATFHLVLLAFLTILSEPLVMAAKWNILLKQKGIKAGYFAIVRILFSSNFLGVTMPSVGMDVIRIYMVKQRNHDFVHATGTLVADRLMAVGVLAMMSLLATPVVWGMVSVPTHVAVGILSVSLLILAGLALAISPVAGNVIKWLSASLGRLAGDNSQHARPWLSIARTALHKGAVFMEQVHISIRSLFAARGRGLLIVFLLNIAVQMLRVTQVHLL